MTPPRAKRPAATPSAVTGRVATPVGVFSIAATVMAVYCATHLKLDSDIRSFMPEGGDAVAASLSQELADSELTRTMIVNLQADDIDVAVAAARRLTSALEAHPEVAWVRSGATEDQLETIYELYFPRRLAFLSSEPARELPERLGASGLANAAARLRHELSTPASALWKQVAPEDPLLAFRSIAERIRGSDPGLTLRDGIFVTEGETHAVLFLASHASAFDSVRQSALLNEIETRVAELSAELGPLVLEQSGLNRFAVGIQESIIFDIQMIALWSTFGIAALFLIFFHSLRAMLVAMLPHAGGVLVATTLGLLAFGSLNGMAVAFGVSLAGVSVDYSIHLLNHHRLAPPGTPTRETLLRLRPSLVLGGLTTIASFAGLAFMNFPGFRQMGILAAASVGSALVLSLTVVPALMEGTRTPPVSRNLAAKLARSVDWLRAVRQRLFILPAGCLVVAAIGIPQITWIDDMSRLTVPDDELLAEEERVRDRVSRYDGSRFVVALGDDLEQALAINDRVERELAALVSEGALEAYRSLHAFLWSSALQRENLAVLRASPDLYPRLDAAFGEAGFRPGAFTAFGEALAAPPPEPLRLSDIESSALAPLVRSLVVELEDATAVLTFLKGVGDDEQLRAAVESIPGVIFFDQREFLGEVYREYRERTIRVVLSGCFAVLALLFLRYRRMRPTIAAMAPSLLVALVLCALAGLFSLETNLLHLVGLILVMGIGVDYGIFMVDGSRDPTSVGTTMLSLLLSCLTTIFVFGVLALSSHPVLNAVGMTTGVGVLLALLLAPVSLVLLEKDGRPAPAPRTPPCS